MTKSAETFWEHERYKKILKKPIIRKPLPAASGALGVSWAGPTGLVIGSLMICGECVVEKENSRNK